MKKTRDFTDVMKKLYVAAGKYIDKELIDAVTEVSDLVREYKSIIDSYETHRMNDYFKKSAKQNADGTDMFQKGDDQMRLWHKDLIPVLPRQQLLGQWRECCAIAKSISTNGTPNHILVNKIMEYPMRHFYAYGMLVHRIMKLRGYKCDFDKFGHYFTYPHETEEIDYNKLFQNWHNKRYLQQCYYNLEEKYDCGGITEDEWKRIRSEVVLRLFW